MSTIELLKHRNEFVLFALIVIRAQRTLDGFSADNLEPGEALIGDFKSCGLTEQEYRTAKKKLKKWKFITTKSTNKGTIAKIINSDVFDINTETDQRPSQQAANGQATTNKNGKNVKNEKGGDCNPF